MNKNSTKTAPPAIARCSALCKLSVILQALFLVKMSWITLH